MDARPVRAICFFGSRWSQGYHDVDAGTLQECVMNDVPLTLVGHSAAVKALDQDISLAARSDAKVLITGESGVGKEVAARLIHSRSLRAHSPMLAINCAGVPETLLESELFGHVRGSFTGAHRDKPGLFEQAHGGTVFLDEIGEMSLRMQASMLRFLESGEIQRVGADRAPVHVNVRVICATNRDLTDRIAHGSFREDLYYRLNVIHVQIPPLREREDDVPVLVEHFLHHFAERHRMAPPTIDELAMDAICRYGWPGNIRQLKNVIERLVVRAHESAVTVADLPPEIRQLAVAPVDPALAPAEALAERLARDLFGRMMETRESFWKVVHDPFMARDLTRDTLRRVVRLGLEQAHGRYADLVPLFNITKDDTKRLLAFLRKNDCLVPSDEQHRPNRPAASTRAFVA
jgi:transcriptional regulator with PAS, ATPase and Fis domain